MCVSLGPVSTGVVPGLPLRDSRSHPLPPARVDPTSAESPGTRRFSEGLVGGSGGLGVLGRHLSVRTTVWAVTEWGGPWTRGRDTSDLLRLPPVRPRPHGSPGPSTTSTRPVPDPTLRHPDLGSTGERPTTTPRRGFRCRSDLGTPERGGPERPPGPSRRIGVADPTSRRPRTDWTLVSTPWPSRAQGRHTTFLGPRRSCLPTRRDWGWTDPPSSHVTPGRLSRGTVRGGAYVILGGSGRGPSTTDVSVLLVVVADEPEKTLPWG